MQGNLQLTQNPSTGVANTIATSGTIRSQEGFQRVTAAAAITGVILTAGEIGGQSVLIQNESAFPITFATDATSNVLDGATLILQPKRSVLLVWDSVAARWGVMAFGGGAVRCEELAFVETGTHTYTGTIALPAGSRIIDIGCDGQALWNSAGACSLIVGDGTDPDGFFTATDLKATDLLAGEINNLEHPGGKAGAYIVSEQRNLWTAAARNVVAVITVASGTGTLGRTRVYVAFVVPVAVAPVVV